MTEVLKKMNTFELVILERQAHLLIGGSLYATAGNLKRAPEICRKYYAEWLYRLISEPKRIRRQKVLPIFALMVMLYEFKMMVTAR